MWSRMWRASSESGKAEKISIDFEDGVSTVTPLRPKGEATFSNGEISENLTRYRHRNGFIKDPEPGRREEVTT